MLDFLMLDANEPLKIGKFWQKQCIFSQIPGQKLDHVEFSNARACSSSNFHFRACSSPLDARFFHTRCNTAFENRQILAKIVHFWSNARAKARSCRIFQCSSMLEPEFWFSSMLEPAQYSNIYFRACSSPLDARLFHTRCNTSTHILVSTTDSKNVQLW